MDYMEQYALLTALKKVVDKELKDLKPLMDEDMKEFYLETGGVKRAVSINGTEVGTQTVTFTKPTDETVPLIIDDAAFAYWILHTDGGTDTVKRLLADGKTRELVLQAATYDGELPDGCALRHEVQPKRIKNVTVRIAPDKVAEAMAAELPDAVHGLLEG